MTYIEDYKGNLVNAASIVRIEVDELQGYALRAHDSLGKACGLTKRFANRSEAEDALCKLADAMSNCSVVRYSQYTDG